MRQEWGRAGAVPWEHGNGVFGPRHSAGARARTGKRSPRTGFGVDRAEPRGWVAVAGSGLRGGMVGRSPTLRSLAAAHRAVSDDVGLMRCLRALLIITQLRFRPCVADFNRHTNFCPLVVWLHHPKIWIKWFGINRLEIHFSKIYRFGLLSLFFGCEPCTPVFEPARRITFAEIKSKIFSRISWRP